MAAGAVNDEDVKRPNGWPTRGCGRVGIGSPDDPIDQAAVVARPRLRLFLFIRNNSTTVQSKNHSALTGAEDCMALEDLA